MEESTDAIIKKIKELKVQVPSDWAEVISKKMNKEARTIRAYATGSRGVKKGQHVRVLEYLKEMEKENRLKIKRLIA